MTNEQLRMFIAVAEQGSYRRAADIVSKTQSTVSFAIKTLEDDLRLQLFSRDGYRSELTPQGQAFLPRAKQVLEQADSLMALGRQLAAGVEPEFTILISGICPMPRILARIKSVIEYCPETDFNITVGHLGGIYEQLNNGNADLAFTPPLRADLRHQTKSVGQVTMVTVAAPGYLASSPEESIPLERIKNYHQIVVRDTARSVPSANVRIVPGGKTWRVTDFATKKELALAGLGWGGIPRHLIVDELADGRLVELHVEDIPVHDFFDIAMVRCKDRPVGPVAEHLWSLGRPAPA
jgi:DNA-binding transcriptional LysR family regulator